MKLYETATAPNPRRVRMFLAEKGLLDEVECVQIDLQKGENLTREFTARNPMRKVPVLELIDGTCISETMAICRYFEEAYPESPKLLGETPLEKAQIEQWLRWIEFYLAMPTGMAFQHSSGYFKDRMNCFPEWGDDCKYATERFFEFLNDHLKEREFICHERISAADLNAFAIVQFARVIKVRMQASQSYLNAWHDRIAARPSAHV
ncbi:glutathione S-transferase family protein [Aliidiomarina halalkaliphila]|uniref:Glutathione S-transferase family protein n=1 Tax=Aliidiomarina halalkaliphila TaxID=2593535 RepID=A0A552X1E4_9GAMM|nr:glutathione S-transferase family protein [Aliidiomarina halalkaliphila]TRW48871.1 glutathione S-transferase family protein [Aliidiomarina halalkaliphila]